jgi:hypothetical protein
MRVAGSMGRAAAAAAAVLTTLVMSATSPAEPVGEAKTSAAIQAGDLAVTGFSGTTLVTDKLPPGVDPVDRTFIDVSGPSLRIFDASSLNGAPARQLLNAPVRLNVPAKDIGQVFALAFDPGSNGAAPQLFVAATSAFGLRIVGAGRAPDGKPVRLKEGAPDASFMDGQFGALSSSSPGAIYKIDGATGAVTSIADTAFSGTLNNGPGIGGLAYDPATRSLYASDLDSGLIHRFGLDYNAADLAQYDHGVAGRRAKGLETVPDDGKRLDITSSDFKADDPSTWGFTQPQRRVDALAVHDGRLYYAVAEGPQIWSVGLRGGAFADDARLEVAVKAEKPFPITGIEFDSSGRMFIAQRGPVQSPYDYGSFADTGGQVLRYEPESPDDPATPDLWKSDPATYAVGTADDSNAGSGGVSLQYGYKPDGTIDLNTCDATVAVTGDTLGTTASGLQLNGLDLVRPANVPPTQSAFIDYDAHQDDQNVRGHVGSVAALRQCGAAAGFPPVEDGGAFPPVEESGAGSEPPVEGGGGGGGGGAFPPVEDGGGGATLPDETQGGGGQTFPEVEEGGGGETAEVDGVSITKSAAPGTCTEQGGCTFNIDITNNSGKDLPELVVGDELTAGAANLGGAKIEGAPPAPWTCTAPPKFTCKHPGPIANGQSVSLPLSFTPTGIGQEPELNNCATLQAAAGGAGAGPAAAVPAPAPGEINGIKVEQTPFPGPCSPADGCEVEIKITNTTAELKKAPLLLVHTAMLPPQEKAIAYGLETLSPLPPQFQCQQANGFTILQCGTDAGKPMTLVPGEPLTMTVKFKPVLPKDDPAAGQSGVLLSNVGISFNGSPLAISTAHLPLQAAAGAHQADGAQPGGVAAPVGPVCATLPVEQPDQAEEPKPSESGQISLLKTGVSCKNKKSCEFNFAIKNSSANDFDGEVVFDDSLTADAGIFGGTTINPAPPAPWSCPPNAQQGFTCTAKLKIPANSAAPPLNLTFELPGGIGAVQTVENCATLKDAPGSSCAKLPLEPPADQQQQQGAQGKPALSIKKTGVAECSDLGGCDFTIEVTNDGDGVFNGPLDITEEVTADGKPVPGTLVIPKGSWKCTQAETPFTCGVPQVEIGPQGKATMNVHVLLSKPTGAKTIENCASVAEQPAKACVTVPLIQGPKLVLKKEAIDGVCDPVCTFRITAKNIGNADFPGPIKIVDFPSDIKSNSGATDIKAEVVSATMVGSPLNVTCTKTGNIACVVGVDRLQPGTDITFDLTMKTAVTDFAGDNCVLRTDIPQGSENPQVCVAMLGLRHQGPNLAIEKRATGPMKDGSVHCDLKKECIYIVTVKNTGTADFVGPIKITDTVSLGVPEVIEQGPGGNIGWTCSTAQNGKGGLGNNPSIECTIPGAPDPLKPGTFGPLAPGKQIELGVSVKPGSTWQGSDLLHNCAEVSADADMGPTKACADVKLDPFDVQVAKTGDQSCQPGGECRFDIDIFDPGPIPHHAPVTVTDKLSGLSSAQIVSITQVSGDDAFPCKPAPTQIPFTCTGDMVMEPGEHNHYTMVVRLPADATAASFSNCATVGGSGEPVPRSEGEPGPAGQQSCHEVKLAPPEQPFSLKIDKTGPASCKPGAQCPFDVTITNTGRKDHSGAVTLTDGLSGAPPMTIVSIEPPLPCTEQPADIPFNCKTADDFTIPAGGKRTFRLTARVPRSADESFTNCAILSPSSAGKKPGSGADEALSSCHAVKVSTPPAQTSEKPECKGGMILMDEGVCACPAGTNWNGRACAVPPRPLPPREASPQQPPPSCKGDRPVGTFPNCCPVDTHFDQTVNPPRGGCVRDGGSKDTTTSPPPPPVCEGKRPVGKFPNCCPIDTHFERSAGPRGGCVGDGKGDGGAGTVTSDPDDTTKPPQPPVCKGDRPVGKFPFCCPVNTHFDRSHKPRPACVSDVSKGTDGTTKPPPPPVCKGDRPVGKFPFCCPVGTHFERSHKPRPACVSDTGNGGTNGNNDNDDKRKCPPGTFGRYPRCRPLPKPTGPGDGGTKPCPPGTHSTRSGQCVEDAAPKPKPTPTPSTTEPSKGKCSGGRIGTPPNCFCRPPMQFIGHKCRLVSKTTKPTPTGPTPTKQCSGGKVPRSGDGACVCPSGTTDSGGKCVGAVR